MLIDLRRAHQICLVFAISIGLREHLRRRVRPVTIAATDANVDGDILKVLYEVADSSNAFEICLQICS